MNRQGVYTDLSIEEYHEDRTVISSTGLKQAKRSSRSFIHYVVNGSDYKSAFDFGNAFEVALIDYFNEGNEFGKLVSVWEKPVPDKSMNLTANKEAKAKFDIDNAGRYQIKKEGAESLETIMGMLEAIQNDKAVDKLLTGTKYQVSCFWKDQETGLQCKSRPDVFASTEKGKNIIVDIKTTKDASVGGFSRECANYDYPLQAVMQMIGAVQSGLFEQVDEYYWLACEKTAPYNYCLYQFKKEDWDFVTDNYSFMMKKAARALDVFRDTETYGKSYGEGYSKYDIVELDLPLWYRPNTL